MCRFALARPAHYSHGTGKGEEVCVACYIQWYMRCVLRVTYSDIWGVCCVLHTVIYEVCMAYYIEWYIPRYKYIGIYGNRYTYVYLGVSMYTCVCIFVYAYICMNVYIYIHIHIFYRRAYYFQGSRQGREVRCVIRTSI